MSGSKKKIINKYGSEGLSLLKDYIDAVLPPFTFCFNLENKIKIKYEN